MKFQTYATITFVAAFASASVNASATNACVLEGKGYVAGNILDIKDCVQRTDERVSEVKLKEMCSSFSKAAQALGGPPAKITYLEACPTGAQGHCTGMGGGLVSFSYYKRSASDLPETKASCELMGGTWK
jgi:hypothetical protein